jgi:hypothetical protein
MGERGRRTGYLWGSLKERDHYENQEVGGSIILKWISEIWNGVLWTGLDPVAGSREQDNELFSEFHKMFGRF